MTKIPRFTFEKFPGANDRLTTQMKSVGEAMAIGRTFQESLQKALRSLETGIDGLDPIDEAAAGGETSSIACAKSCACRGRTASATSAMRSAPGCRSMKCMSLSRIDPWFLAQIEDLVREEQAVQAQGLEAFDRDRVRELKRKGFSDRRLATLLGIDETSVRRRRVTMGIRPVYKRVDTCAAEFATSTAYMYSTYDEECEADPTDRKKIMILGGGPNRIGQGIEFDYCCVHAALALREAGSRRSWSTAIPRPSRPTTTPPIGCTSSR